MLKRLSLILVAAVVTPAAARASGGKCPNVVIVLDKSGSMAEYGSATDSCINSCPPSEHGSCKCGYCETNSDCNAGETCTGLTGHAEVVLVVFDPTLVSYADLLKVFWEAHDPTQGMRQGNDVGTTYRSAIYAFSGEQQVQALASRDAYGVSLTGAGHGRITTEIQPAGPFYFAEKEHQQYLARNPSGHCGLKGTGVSCAMPAPASASA